MLMGQFAANGLLGTGTPALAQGLSLGIAGNILATGLVQTVDAGVVGAGVSTGKIIGPNPGVLTPLLIGQMAAGGFLGVAAVPMATAISLAFCTWFLAGNLVITVNAGVGVGVATGIVSGLQPSAMQTMLLGTLAGSGMLGVQIPQLAQAVANSIVPHLLTMGIYIAPITGSPSIIPGAGSGFGKIT
jgi:hypothetical protein